MIIHRHGDLRFTFSRMMAAGPPCLSHTAHCSYFIGFCKDSEQFPLNWQETNHMHYETFHPVALPSTTANLQPQYFCDFTEKPTSVTVSGFPVLAQLDWDGEEPKRAGINLNGEDNDGRSLAGFILVVPHHYRAE
jgi:hypothetical protein